MRRKIVGLLLPVLILGQAYGQKLEQRPEKEQVYVIQLDPSRPCAITQAYRTEYEVEKKAFWVGAKDTLNMLDKFVENEFPVLETNCFYPSLKFVFKQFTYVLSPYCATIVKFKNSGPYESSGEILANDFIFTPSLIKYFERLENSAFSKNYKSFYAGLRKKTPSAMSVYGQDMGLGFLGMEPYDEPSPKKESAVVKPESKPAVAETKKTEPAKVESKPEVKPAVAETKKTEPAKVESKPEVKPAVAETKKVEPAKVESKPEVKPAVAEAKKVEPAKVEPKPEVKPAVAETKKTEPAKVESKPEVKPAVAETKKTEPAKVESKPEVKPAVAETKKVEPAKVESKPEVKPAVAETKKTEPAKVESKPEVKPAVAETKKTEPAKVESKPEVKPAVAETKKGEPAKVESKPEVKPAVAETKKTEVAKPGVKLATVANKPATAADKKAEPKPAAKPGTAPGATPHPKGTGVEDDDKPDEVALEEEDHDDEHSHEHDDKAHSAGDVKGEVGTEDEVETYESSMELNTATHDIDFEADANDEVDGGDDDEMANDVDVDF